MWILLNIKRKRYQNGGIIIVHLGRITVFSQLVFSVTMSMFLVKRYLSQIFKAWSKISSRYFIYRLMVHQSCSIVQNLVVNYHLAVSYPQLCHIGININHWYVIIIPMHIMLPFSFFRVELWIIFISY